MNALDRQQADAWLLCLRRHFHHWDLGSQSCPEATVFGVSWEADSEGVGRREEVRVGSDVLKVLGAFWDKLEEGRAS
jgi:hypothetical protein